MKRFYIIIIILIIVLIIFGLIFLARLFLKSKNRIRQSVIETVHLEDFYSDFINLSDQGLLMISLYPTLKQQIINSDGKQVSEKDLTSAVVLDEESRLSWSKDGNYLVMVNRESSSLVFDLKNNQKIKELSPNIKLATEVIDSRFYYWYSDSKNQINNISTSAVSTNDWQAVADIPENKKLSSLAISPDGLNLIFSTFSDEEMDEKLYIINLSTKDFKLYQGPLSPQRVNSISQYLLIEYLNEKIERELAILDKNNWQDFKKAQIVKGQSFLPIRVDNNRVSLIIEKDKNTINLLIIPDNKTYEISKLFQGRRFAVPDSDIVADFSELTFADIKNAVIFQDNLYLQIGNGVYKAKLD